MTEPTLNVQKYTQIVPVQTLGTDKQGRQLYRCPTPGCGDTAYFDEEGRGHCPSDEAMQAALRRMLEGAGLLTPQDPS